jgi:alkanesulfonate monooxygenase SsuD/methylene tetrahydromethanopterin reductase-like flavin-dependent oxidoreductase (luciferase family)
MIEVGIFDTGSMDLPAKRTASGIRVPDGTLADIHTAAQRLTLHQIRRCVLADRLGFNYFWMSEHHFGTEGAELSSNPLQSETAMAVLTNRIHLGQLANILAFWNPLRLAEQIAILDVISGGRVEVGFGRGYQSREAETFGQRYGSTVMDQERNRAYHQEAIEILRKAWTEESFSHRGEFWTIPPTYTKWNHSQTIAQFNEPGFGPPLEDVFDVGPPDMYSSGPEIMASTTKIKQLSVLPQPVQKPHPPLWEPVTSERSIRWAAQQGLNGNSFNDPLMAFKRRVEVYMEAAEKAGWPDPLNRGEFKPGWDAERHRGISAGRFIHVQEGTVGNVDRARRAVEFEWDFYKPFGFAAVLADPGQTPDPNLNVTAEVLEERGVAIFGSKQQVIEGLLKMRDVCYSEGDFIVNVWFESGGLSHEELEEQIQFFGEEILPVLQRECGGAPDREPTTVQEQMLPRADVGAAA